MFIHSQQLFLDRGPCPRKKPLEGQLLKFIKAILFQDLQYFLQWSGPLALTYFWNEQNSFQFQLFSANLPAISLNKYVGYFRVSFFSGLLDKAPLLPSFTSSPGIDTIQVLTYFTSSTIDIIDWYFSEISSPLVSEIISSFRFHLLFLLIHNINLLYGFFNCCSFLINRCSPMLHPSSAFLLFIFSLGDLTLA